MKNDVRQQCVEPAHNVLELIIDEINGSVYGVIWPNIIYQMQIYAGFAWNWISRFLREILSRLLCQFRKGSVATKHILCVIFKRQTRHNVRTLVNACTWKMGHMPVERILMWCLMHEVGDKRDSKQPNDDTNDERKMPFPKLNSLFFWVGKTCVVQGFLWHITKSTVWPFEFEAVQVDTLTRSRLKGLGLPQLYCYPWTTKQLYFRCCFNFLLFVPRDHISHASDAFVWIWCRKSISLRLQSVQTRVNANSINAK